MTMTDLGESQETGQGESQWEAQMQEHLLEALEDYRRGIAEAPRVFKWSVLGAVAAAKSDEKGSDWQGKELRSDADSMTFVASTGEVDRHGDVVSVAGWKLDAYRKNPVFLWAHDYSRPAIGRATQVWTTPSEAGGVAGQGPALMSGTPLAPALLAPRVASKSRVRPHILRSRSGRPLSRWVPEGRLRGLPPAALRGAPAPPDRQVPRHPVYRAGAAGGERRPRSRQRKRGAPLR